MINLYSLPGCGMCNMLKQELINHKINFQTITDIDALNKKNITHVPVLEVENNFMNFKEALQWIRNR